MRIPAVAVAVALLFCACGDRQKGKLTTSPTELQIFVEVESTVEEMAAIQVTVRPRDGSPDLVVDMQPPEKEGEDWSQLLDGIPAGDYAARASALDASRRLLFHSVDTEQFRVYARQTTVLKLVLRDPKGGEEIWEPHFISVRVEGTPAQGSESAIVVRAGGGEGDLRLSGSGDGVFGSASGDPRSEEGAVLGWTPLRLGANTIELELRDAAERRVTTTLEVSVGCPEDLMLCLGSCVDTDEDPLHCGGCNRPCANGECVFGFCMGEGRGGTGEPGGGGGVVGAGGSGGAAGAGGTGGTAGSGGMGGGDGTGGSGGDPGAGGTGGVPGSGGTGGSTGTGGTGGVPGAGGTGGEAGSGGSGEGGSGGTAGTGGSPGSGGTGGDPGGIGGSGGYEPDPDLPVPPGSYHYVPVVTSGITSPYAGDWHPSGDYALVASYSNFVYKYDAATESITQVGSNVGSITWTGVAFTEDGSFAILVGTSVSGGKPTGRLFVWDHAAGTLTENTSEKAADTRYQRVKRSPEGELWILGSRTSPTNVFLWPVDPITGRGAVKASWAGTECQDMAFATDVQGRRAIAVVCGTGGIDLWHLDGGGAWVQGNTAGLGNTSRISGRPQGDYALAIGWTSQINNFHRFEQGEWIRNKGGWLPGAYQVSFSTDGKRALVLGNRSGDEGQVYEFRHDLLTRQEITNVPIPNMGASPYRSGTVRLNEALWRPGCDGGIILAGSASSPTSGYIIRFEVTNGEPCP